MKRIKYRLILLAVVLMGVCANGFALEFPLPSKHNDMVGKLQFYVTKPGDSFTAIARHFNIAFDDLYLANNGVAPTDLADNADFQPVPGTTLIIPTQYLLPPYPRKGIIINVAEHRLYYYPKNKNKVFIFPVGVGKEDWSTPLGELKIMQKIKNPFWIVPDSIMKYRQERGDPVEKIVKAGPDNPLGDYAMRLSLPTYLIHGTNEPNGVGRRSSAGCIRLYPENIEELFAMTPKGTPVRIINQPYLAGWQDGSLYVEAFRPYIDKKQPEKAQLNVKEVVKAALKKSFDGGSAVDINWQEVEADVEKPLAMPVLIS